MYSFFWSIPPFFFAIFLFLCSLAFFLFPFKCRLEELFLCLNDYRTVLLSPCSYPSLRLLHITDNNLTDWAELHKLGQMFPGLDTLILANNPLTSIVDSQETLARLFPNLRSINLHNSGMKWDRIISHHHA